MKVFASTDRRELNVISTVIKLRRESLGLTQEQISEQSQVSRSVVSRIENGTRAVDFSRALSVSKALGIMISVHVRPPRNGEYIRVRWYECTHCGNEFYSAQVDASWCPCCGYEGTLTRGLFSECLVIGEAQ